jgi:hypothetical protein
MIAAAAHLSQLSDRSKRSYSEPFPLVVRHALSRVYDE